MLGNVSEEEMQQGGELLQGMDKEGPEGLQGMLSKMMSQMFSPEVLGEPMREAEAKFKEVIADSSLSEEQRSRYGKQLEEVVAINQEFSRGDQYDSEKVGKHLEQLQAHGDLPEQVVTAMGGSPDALKGLEGAPPGCGLQ